MNEVDNAVAVLRSGGLVALPTETVYGLAADAANELAVRGIFAAKGRPSTHPLIVHLSRVDQLSDWAREIPDPALRLARALWPGPLTLVLKRTECASDAVTGSQDTVALRVPRHPLTLKILAAFGGGVAAPSANRFGRVSPTTAQHVRDEFGGALEHIVDGGPCEVGVESTIVDFSRETPTLLRPGGASVESIEALLGSRLSREAGDVRAPGMLESHYAPRAGLVLTTAEQIEDEARARVALGGKVAVLSPQAVSLSGAQWLAIPADVEALARSLYAVLREVDAKGFDVAVVAMPSDAGVGLAVRDRLMRAARR